MKLPLPIIIGILLILGVFASTPWLYLRVKERVAAEYAERRVPNNDDIFYVEHLVFYIYRGDIIKGFNDSHPIIDTVVSPTKYPPEPGYITGCWLRVSDRQDILNHVTHITQFCDVNFIVNHSEIIKPIER